MKNRILLIALAVSAALAFTGCSSSSYNGGNSYTQSGSYSYGTGPNKTRPKEQKEKVNISGIGGAKPVYEYQRTGGCNKDYKVLGKNYMVWNGTSSYIEEGTASWYGPGFHGKRPQTVKSITRKDIPQLIRICLFHPILKLQT